MENHKRAVEFSLLVSLFAISTLLWASVATAETAPPIVGIDIVDYQSSANQQPGTTATYWVDVNNTGVLELNPVYVSASKIPSGWMKGGENASLNFGDTARLYYNITIPQGQAGYIVYSLDVYGQHGQATASDSKPVMINITAAGTSSTTTTSTSVPATSAVPSGSSSLEIVAIVILAVAIAIIIFKFGLARL